MIGDEFGNTYSDIADFHTQRQMQVAQNVNINDTVSDAITSSSRKYGLDVNMMKSIYSIESDFDPNSNISRKTQYKGLGQLGTEEWARWGQGKNIYDPYANTDATARLTKANMNWFQETYGRQPTQGETYLMHLQGRGFFIQGDMTNVRGNPYPGMHGLQDPHTFLAGWSAEVDRRAEEFRTGKQIPRIKVTPSNYPSYENATIDHSNSVPLVAGALHDKEGNTYGSTFSNLVPRYANIQGHTLDMFEGVHHHEMKEVEAMQQMIAGGMSSKDAYTKAHNEVATPAEEKYMKDKFVSMGIDPQKGWEEYQNHWKEMAKKTENAPVDSVHPDLYLHPYDGHKTQADVESKAGRTIDQMRAGIGAVMSGDAFKLPDVYKPIGMGSSAEEKVWPTNAFERFLQSGPGAQARMLFGLLGGEKEGPGEFVEPMPGEREYPGQMYRDIKQEAGKDEITQEAQYQGWYQDQRNIVLRQLDQERHLNDLREAGAPVTSTATQPSPAQQGLIDAMERLRAQTASTVARREAERVVGPRPESRTEGPTPEQRERLRQQTRERLRAFSQQTERVPRGWESTESHIETPPRPAGVRTTGGGRIVAKEKAEGTVAVKTYDSATMPMSPALRRITQGTRSLAYDIRDKDNKTVSNVSGTISGKTFNVNVDPASFQSGHIGPSAWKRFIKQLAQDHPEVDYIQGGRISGARWGPARDPNATDLTQRIKIPESYKKKPE